MLLKMKWLLWTTEACRRVGSFTLQKDVLLFRTHCACIENVEFFHYSESVKWIKDIPGSVFPYRETRGYSFICFFGPFHWVHLLYKVCPTLPIYAIPDVCSPDSEFSTLLHVYNLGCPAHANGKWSVITEAIGTWIWPENSSVSSQGWQACWSSQPIQIVWKLWSADPDLLQPVYPDLEACQLSRIWKLLTVTAIPRNPRNSP
jgi:hypothetical protein